MAKSKNKGLTGLFSNKEIDQIVEEVVEEQVASKDSVFRDLIIDLFLSGALEAEDMRYTQKQEKIVEAALLAVLKDLNIEPTIKGIRASKLARNVQNALISCLPKKGR